MSGSFLSTATGTKKTKGAVDSALPPKIRMVVTREDALFWHYKVAELENEIAVLMRKRRRMILPHHLKPILEATKDMRDWLDAKGL